jgi:hypothetical protein
VRAGIGSMIVFFDTLSIFQVDGDEVKENTPYTCINGCLQTEDENGNPYPGNDDKYYAKKEMSEWINHW